MLKSLLGLAPQEEPDGSFSPSKLALKLATSDVTDYAPVSYEASPGERSRILVLFSEQKNMTMANGRAFSTGSHPVEALVPMLHLQRAGFGFEIATPGGKPVVLEQWAMPTRDAAVMGLLGELKARLEHPRALGDVVASLEEEGDAYAAVFIPGGHGAMLGLPDDPNVGTLLRWFHEHDRYTISICHGPASLLATTLYGHDFLYAGYELAAFPDAVDKKLPLIGYLPGPMPWHLCARLRDHGARIVNARSDDTCHVDRRLITGASPAAADKLGRLAATTLLQHQGDKAS